MKDKKKIKKLWEPIIVKKEFRMSMSIYPYIYIIIIDIIISNILRRFSTEEAAAAIIQHPTYSIFIYANVINK